MTERLFDILKRLNAEHGTGQEMTPDDYEKQRVKWANDNAGNLNEEDGYNCDKCKNKGVIYFLKENQLSKQKDFTQRECSCMAIRRALRRAKQSGLNNILTDYTFDKYETPEQWQRIIKEKALNFCKDNSAHWFYIGGQSGCVDCDTEYFNGEEWRKISEYDGGKVLSFIPTGKYGKGKAELVTPSRYIKAPAVKLWHLKTERGGIDQVLSSNHNFAYVSSKGNLNKKPFEEIIKKHRETIQGFYGRVITTFEYSGAGLDLSEAEIRLMVAVIADGCFKFNTKRCWFNVKKQRKKERIVKLLNAANIEYKRYEKSNGYSTFVFNAPLREKIFSSHWYNATNEQLKIITDEVLNWDGSINNGRRTFSTTSKESADFIQFAFASVGIRATLRKAERADKKSPEYNLCISNNNLLHMVSTGGHKKANIEEIPTKDGFQYCFTVPSGLLVLRRNGRIFITGNSGKTHICTAICGHYIKAGKNVRYMLWRDDAVKLKSVVNDFEQYQNQITEFKNVDVLYIDDFFKTKDGEEPTPADINLAFELLNYRLLDKDKITIISSEFTINRALELDEATIGRIYQQAGNYKISIDRDTRKNYRLK